MDAASLSFFMQCGVPPWRELVKTRGIVGTPLLEIHTKFLKAATYGEDIVDRDPRRRMARQDLHAGAPRDARARRGGEDLICEGREIRAFVRRDADNPDRLRAMPIPDDIQGALRS